MAEPRGIVGPLERLRLHEVASCTRSEQKSAGSANPADHACIWRNRDEDAVDKAARLGCGLGPSVVALRATATLVRRDGGVSFTLHAAHLRPGHAYTVWFVVLNNREACSATPCSAADILQNPATEAQVTYGAGHVSGRSGKGSFSASVATGPIAGWLADRELSDPLGAEIQLVLNDHGPKLAAYMPGMIQTYRAGCTDASLPAIFPPSARADGTPGPNACQLYQVAVFTGS